MQNDKAKSTTDIHWNQRAQSVTNDIEVNIMDIFQRDLEYDHVCSYLKPEMRILEVGCGNGFSTKKFRECVAHVDAFDYAEDMIERARKICGETNNRFFHDNLLAPESIKETYDAVICVRVLINLRNLDEQVAAMEQLAKFVKPGGILILVEGFTEGFKALNALRKSMGMSDISPAPINYYSSSDWVTRRLNEGFKICSTFHLGAYDCLTRVLYPAIVGEKNAVSNTIFSEKCRGLAALLDPTSFANLSRVQGFVAEKAK